MKRLMKLALIVLFLGVVAGAIAAYQSRKRFESMTDDEIRAMLAAKLEGRVSEEQLASIQDSVVAGVRARRPETSDHYVEDVAEAVEDLTEVEDHIDDDQPHAIEDLEPVDSED